MGFLNDMLMVLQRSEVGVIGDTLFGGDLPPAPDDAVCLYEYAGNQPERMAKHHHPGLQLVVRNMEYKVGRELIQSVSEVLVTLDDLDDGDALYLKANALQEPHSLGKDSNGRFLFVQNFIVTYFEED